MGGQTNGVRFSAITICAIVSAFEVLPPPCKPETMISSVGTCNNERAASQSSHQLRSLPLSGRDLVQALLPSSHLQRQRYLSQVCQLSLMVSAEPRSSSPQRFQVSRVLKRLRSFHRMSWWACRARARWSQRPGFQPINSNLDSALAFGLIFGSLFETASFLENSSSRNSPISSLSFDMLTASCGS